MDEKSLIGRVVISKAGRDKGRKFIILNVINDQYITICDGDLRKIQNPKKKKIKHINFTSIYADEIIKLLNNNEKINDIKIKKFLQSIESNKEV